MTVKCYMKNYVFCDIVSLLKKILFSLTFIIFYELYKPKTANGFSEEKYEQVMFHIIYLRKSFVVQQTTFFLEKKGFIASSCSFCPCCCPMLIDI